MEEKKAEEGVMFAPLSADDEDNEDQLTAPMEIESLCVNCELNGLTKLLCVRIPFYRRVILMSFHCDHCGYHNSELQSGEPVREHGTILTLNVANNDDMNRQIVKSEYAAINIPDILLEIPYRSQPGEVTTVEGVLQRTKAGLMQDQQRRRIEAADDAEKIEQFVLKIDDLLQLKHPFTLVLDDPTGNCFIENPNPWHVDAHLQTTHYTRTMTHTKLLGLADDDAVEENDDGTAPEWDSPEDAKREVLHFPGTCSNCAAPVETLMKPTDVPYFQSVIIMATSCDACGHRTNEVKSGGAIKAQGCRLSLRVLTEDDLKRDVLKSDTCNLAIPELEFEVGWGALSGRFTTVEGLLTATKEQLFTQCSLILGDSAPEQKRSKMLQFLSKFDDILALKMPVTLVLDDSAGNSYIQSFMAPLEDSRLTKDYYVRSFAQDEELGLNDMKTENYENLSSIAEEEKSK